MPPRAARILVVEDDWINQEVFKMALKRMGHVATLVATGEEAVRVAREEPFDLLLLDILLPGIDGCRTLALIRETGRAENRCIPAVAVTAMATPEVEAACLASGFDAFITKPFVMKDLRRVIGLASAACGTESA